MRKLLSLLLAVSLLLGLCAPGNAEDAPALPLQGTDRLAIPVPQGWNVIRVDEEDEFSLTAIKGGSDLTSLVFNPSLSVMYVPLGTMVLDARELTDTSEDIAPFSLGGYDWTGYRYTSFGMSGISLTASGDFGTITAVVSPQGMMGGASISLEDPDVQAILAGITVKATVEADWAVINEDGTLTVRLPGREGFAWSTGMSGSFDLNGGENGPEGEVAEAEEDGVYTAVITLRGSGVFSQGFSLGNEDDEAAQARISVLCEDGKAVALTDAALSDAE